MKLSFETARQELLARLEGLFEQINFIIAAVARLQYTYVTHKPLLAK